MPINWKMGNGMCTEGNELSEDQVSGLGWAFGFIPFFMFNFRKKFSSWILHELKLFHPSKKVEKYLENETE